MLQKHLENSVEQGKVRDSVSKFIGRQNFKEPNLLFPHGSDSPRNGALDEYLCESDSLGSASKERKERKERMHCETAKKRKSNKPYHALSHWW